MPRDEVADGVDALDVGAEELVDTHGRAVHVEADLLEAQVAAVGHASRRREDHVGLKRGAVGQGSRHALANLGHRIDRHAQVEDDAQRLERLLHLSLDALVVAGQHAAA